MTKALAIITFSLALEAAFLLQVSLPARAPASPASQVAVAPRAPGPAPRG